jgi:hypothetical protein
MEAATAAEQGQGTRCDVCIDDASRDAFVQIMPGEKKGTCAWER